MKKTVIILVIMTFIIQGFSQKRTNDLFNKKQTSISFSPSFGLSMGKIIYLGANFQLGYNILATNVKLDSCMALLKCLATLQQQAVQLYVGSQYF